MEKKEITISKDTLVDAMANASIKLMDKSPKEDQVFTSTIVMFGALFTSELVDILFGGGETSTDHESEGIGQCVA